MRKIPWKRKWQPSPVFLPGEFYGQRSLAGYSPWGHKRVRHDLATKQQNKHFTFFQTPPGRHRPQAGGAPPGTARPQAPAPTLGVGRPLRAAQGDRQDQSHGPRDLTRREAGHAWPGRTLEPGDPAQLAFRAGAHSTGSGPRPWGSHEPRVLASRTSASSRGAGLHPPWPRPVRSSGLRWGGGCQRAGPPSPGPRASRGGR